MNGRADGKGEIVWRYLKNGEWKGSSYTGAMRDGKRHGRGVYVWPSGSRYEGDSRDDKQHGRGVKLWANGDRYEGERKNDKKHGRGIFTLANGDNCAGDWRYGTLLGTDEGMENGQYKKCLMDGGTINFKIEDDTSQLEEDAAN